MPTRRRPNPELDPELVDARVLLAEVRQKQYQWAEAEAEFKRAIELGPNSPGAHFSYALFLALQGRVDEAMAQAQRASELDPPVLKGPFPRSPQNGSKASDS